MAQDELLRAGEFEGAPACEEARIFRCFFVVRYDLGHSGNYSVLPSRDPSVVNAGCWVVRLGDRDALYAGEHFVEGFCVAGLVEKENEFKILDVHALDGVGAWAGSVTNENGAVAFVGN